MDGLTDDVDTLSGIEILSFGDETVNVLDTATNEDEAIFVDVVGALGDVKEASSLSAACPPAQFFPPAP